MKYSAISDWGWETQVVSLPSTASGPVSSTVSTARLSASMLRSVTVPALTPPTRTSEPWTTPKALYIWILYVWVSSAPAKLVTHQATAATSSAAMSAIRLMAPSAPDSGHSHRGRR